MVAKNKTVRAWAILSRERRGKIALGVLDCSYKIFPAEDCAEIDSLAIKGRIDEIVPITITYKLPTNTVK